MDTPILVALIGGFFALIGLFLRRWFELSATRPKAAAIFIQKCAVRTSALAGELGIGANASDVASLKEHLWPWQAASIDRMYKAILTDEECTDSYRKKVHELHEHVSRYL